MLDIGWSELLVIGVVALIVVGPKDLPMMFRTLGRFTAKVRAMGREFQRAMDDAAKQSGMDETVRDLKTMTSKKNLGLDALESAASKFEKWDPTKPGVKPASPIATAPVSPGPATAAAKPAAGPETTALAARLAKERAENVKKTAASIAAAKAAKAEAVLTPPASPVPTAPAKAGMRRSAAKATPQATATVPVASRPAVKPVRAAQVSVNKTKVAQKAPAKASKPAAITAPTRKPRAKKSDT
jgi:sec-independent protein translocase protein TatB